MQHALDGVRAKIKRAVHHLNEFISTASPFEHGAYGVRIERDRQESVIRFFAKATGLSYPPLELSLIAGEAAHQLRSALDHLFWQLAIVNNQTPNRKCSFPIFESLDEFESRGRAIIERVSKSAGAIIESVQPCQRGTSANKDTLWMLHDLNNTDKHRLVPTYFLVGNHSRVSFPNGEYAELNLLIYPSKPLKDGARLYFFPAANPDVEMQTELHCSVAFEKIGGVELQFVVPFLTQAIAKVTTIVDRLAGEFS